MQPGGSRWCPGTVGFISKWYLAVGALDKGWWVLVFQHRAVHCTDPSLKEAFKDVARHWLALAERVDWLDRQHNGQQNPISYTNSKPDDTRKSLSGLPTGPRQKGTPGIVPTELPMACRAVRGHVPPDRRLRGQDSQRGSARPSRSGDRAANALTGMLGNQDKRLSDNV